MTETPIPAARVLNTFMGEINAMKDKVIRAYKDAGERIYESFTSKQGQTIFYFGWEAHDDEDHSEESVLSEYRHGRKEIGIPKDPLLDELGEWTNDRYCMPLEWVRLVVARAYAAGYEDGINDDESFRQKMAEAREQDEP